MYVCLHVSIPLSQFIHIYVSICMHVCMSPSLYRIVFISIYLSQLVCICFSIDLCRFDNFSHSHSPILSPRIYLSSFSTYHTIFISGLSLASAPTRMHYYLYEYLFPSKFGANILNIFFFTLDSLSV